ncbi:DNA repair protein rhp57 [Knufia fluminis]|uniref:DNA repair protein rhp57 n=1 Tax=Knufia fluminis TaxID=191047 RepID=A0AAN8EFU1_9EURO|nr:DNA repair protein rhp57 [Knufia fluminis]
MADLIEILPNFDLQPWRHLTYSLEKKNILTAELVSLDPIEIARKCPLPLKEVRRMAAAVTEALRADAGYRCMPPPPRPQDKGDSEEPPRKRVRLEDPKPSIKDLQYVKTLDARIDEALGGGFPAGSICEIVGESAVGKTQFVLTLLLTAQLPAPRGLGRSAIYLSTEDPLNTRRLQQILRSHPQILELPPEDQPSLDHVLGIEVHNVEMQEHMITFQLPEAIRRYNAGLVVIDSIAANFRIEFQGASRKVLTERAVALTKLGKALRKIAHEQNVAIVCTNQVSDRFDDDKTRLDKVRLLSSQSQGSSQATQRYGGGTSTPTQTQQNANSAARMQPPSVGRAPSAQGLRPPPSTHQAHKDEVMSLDYQQRFFTGWGDDARASPFDQMKTPALGLTWANQLDARIVLKISNTHDRSKGEHGNESYLWSTVKRRRHMKVVFAPWAAPSMDEGVEYELEMQGPVSIEPVGKKRRLEDQEFDGDFDLDEERHEDDEHAELLDPKYWEGIEDEEFP